MQTVANPIIKELLNHVASAIKSTGAKVFGMDAMNQFFNDVSNNFNDIQAAIYGIDASYLNNQYIDDISDLQQVVEAWKYNKPGTDAVILDNNHRIFLIDHSSHKEYLTHREEGRHGLGIRKVYDLNNLTEDDIKEIIRNVASGYDYSTEDIRRLLQNLQVKEKYSNSSFIDAELRGVIDSNTKLYGKDRGKWSTGGYGYRGQNNYDGKSSLGTKGSLGQTSLEEQSSTSPTSSFLFTEKEYKEFLEEHELDEDKASMFVLNFLEKVLKVKPRKKVVKEKTISNFPTADSSSVDSYKFEDFVQKIFGVYPAGLLEKANQKNFKELVAKYLEEGWVKQIKSQIDHVNSFHKSILDEKYTTRNQLINTINTLQRYLRNPKYIEENLDSLDPTSKKIITEAINRGEKGKQYVGFLLQESKKKLNPIQEEIKQQNFAKYAKLTKLKNRLLALHTIPNITELIATRLELERDAYKMSEEEWNEKCKPFQELYEKVQNTIKAGHSDFEKDANPVFQGLKDRDRVSFSYLIKRITKLHPEYAPLLDLLEKANPDVKIEIQSVETS